jgi:hypothetical protein
MNKNKEQIIDDMCFAYRHDFWLDKIPEHPLSGGMTDIERNGLRNRMLQIFDNCIAPHMKYTVELVESQKILIDQHQENMHNVRDLLLKVAELLE